MENVLVTGGAGFIGSHLVEGLLQEKKKVIIIDNFLSGDRKNIQRFLGNDQCIHIEYDLTRDISPIREKLIGVTHIFHLASPASPNKKSPRSYINHPIDTMLVNSFGTYQLLEVAKEQKAAFLYASTSEIYGDPTVSPQKETYFGNVNSVGIRSVYDEAKRFGEAMTMSYIREFHLNARIVRIFNTYGPQMQKDDGRVVSNFITQALANQPLTMYGDGSQTRSFCYISDMVAGVLQAMFVQGSVGDVFNLGNPDERTIREIATIILSETGSKSAIVNEPLPEDDPHQRKPDITKAKTMLNWEPKVSLQEGIQKTIAYFKNV